MLLVAVRVVDQRMLLTSAMNFAYSSVSFLLSLSMMNPTHPIDTIIIRIPKKNLKR